MNGIRLRLIGFACLAMFTCALCGPPAQAGPIVSEIGFELLESEGPFEVQLTDVIPAPLGHFELDTAVFSERADALGGYHFAVRVFGVTGPMRIGIDKDVFNFTGIDWSDFHIDIEEFPNLPTSAGAPFFSQVENTSGQFDTTIMMEQSVWFLDGVVPDGDMAAFWLGINIPGPNGFLNNQIPVYDFVIWQHPSIVPEPRTLMVWCVLGLIAGTTARRRWRQ